MAESEGKGPTHFVALPPEEFVAEAERIVGGAQERGIVLRILGALAIYIHSKHVPEALAIYDKIKRFGEGKPMFTDLDLMAYSKQRKGVMEYFEKVLKFKYDMLMRVLWAGKRLIYFHPKDYYHVDVFFDKLEFSHDVVFGNKPGKGRLELDYPTISLADIVLEKVQIHQINLKDIVDLIVLFYGHDVCDRQEKECIDGKYVAKVLADDWGFWYDATTNLKKVKSFTDKFLSEGKLTPKEHDTVIARVDKLLKMIDEEPKTKKWKKRAKVGTSKPWYREVEEVVR